MKLYIVTNEVARLCAARGVKYAGDWSFPILRRSKWQDPITHADGNWMTKGSGCGTPRKDDGALRWGV